MHWYIYIQKTDALFDKKIYIGISFSLAVNFVHLQRCCGVCVVIRILHSPGLATLAGLFLLRLDNDFLSDKNLPIRESSLRERKIQRK